MAAYGLAGAAAIAALAPVCAAIPVACAHVGIDMAIMSEAPAPAPLKAGGVPRGAVGKGPVISGPQIGRLTVTASRPSASEVAGAQYMASLGKRVVLRDPEGTRAQGRTSDLLVDGVPWDVYTPHPDTAVKAIVNKVAKKHSQVHGGGVIVDLSQTRLSASEFDGMLVRVNNQIRSWGKTSFISDVRFIGGADG